MIQARAALYGHLRTFFDAELRGVFEWTDVLHIPEEPAQPPSGKKTNPFGKYREKVEIRFGLFNLAAESTHESPPLGRIHLEYPGGTIEGPIDEMTWRRCGAAIRMHAEMQGAESDA